MIDLPTSPSEFVLPGTHVDAILAMTPVERKELIDSVSSEMSKLAVSLGVVVVNADKEVPLLDIEIGKKDTLVHLRSMRLVSPFSDDGEVVFPERPRDLDSWIKTWQHRQNLAARAIARQDKAGVAVAIQGVRPVLKQVTLPGMDDIELAFKSSIRSDTEFALLQEGFRWLIAVVSTRIREKKEQQDSLGEMESDSTIQATNAV